jgi:hypothetical protein
LIRIQRNIASIEFLETTKTIASITCFKGNIDVGSIIFLEILPLDENIMENGKIRMRLHLSRFNDVIGILRYEEPLRMFFDDVKKEAYINTGTLEPRGEQEGV